MPDLSSSIGAIDQGTLGHSSSLSLNSGELANGGREMGLENRESTSLTETVQSTALWPDSISLLEDDSLSKLGFGKSYSDTMNGLLPGVTLVESGSLCSAQTESPTPPVEGKNAEAAPKKLPTDAPKESIQDRFDALKKDIGTLPSEELTKKIEELGKDAEVDTKMLLEIAKQLDAYRKLNDIVNPKPKAAEAGKKPCPVEPEDKAKTLEEIDQHILKSFFPGIDRKDIEADLQRNRDNWKQLAPMMCEAFEKVVAEQLDACKQELVKRAQPSPPPKN